MLVDHYLSTIILNYVQDKSKQYVVDNYHILCGSVHIIVLLYSCSMPFIIRGFVSILRRISYAVVTYAIAVISIRLYYTYIYSHAAIVEQ